MLSNFNSNTIKQQMVRAHAQKLNVKSDRLNRSNVEKNVRRRR